MLSRSHEAGARAVSQHRTIQTHSFFWDAENITGELHTQKGRQHSLGKGHHTVFFQLLCLGRGLGQQTPYNPSQAVTSVLGCVAAFFACQLDKSLSCVRTNPQNRQTNSQTHSESQACNSQKAPSCFLPLSEESSFLDRIFLFRPRLPFFVSPPFSPSPPPSRPEQLSACLAIVFYSVEEKTDNKKYNMY